MMNIRESLALSLFYTEEKGMEQIRIALTQGEFGLVDERLYGQFIEQLGDCIEGGVYDRGSSFADDTGVRLDVLTMAKRLNPPVIRFPGGTVMCIYHWQDHVGPLSERKRKKNLIWGGALCSDFGTAEFVDYCRRVGAEPMLCVNMASGTPEEAGAWVEYCNGTEDTYYANLRRSHGYEAPFNVRYWCIGNECYAEPDIGIQHDVNVYIRDAKEFIKFMKLSDPAIETVIVGGDDTENWNRPVLDALGDFTDYFSYHFYAAENGKGLYGPFEGERQFAKKIDELSALLEEYPDTPVNYNKWYRFPPRKGKIRLAVDEWNIWQYQDDGIYGLHMTYNWRDAVWCASMMNRMIASPHIALANMAQLCNIIAPIVADRDGCHAQTIFYPCEAYRKIMYGKRVQVSINGQYAIDGGEAGEVDAISCAAVERDGKTCLALVNRDFENDVMCTLPLFVQGVCMTAEHAADVCTRERNCVAKREIKAEKDAAFLLPRGAVCLLEEV